MTAPHQTRPAVGRPAVRPALAGCLLLALLVAACGDGRAAQHAKQADEHLAAGRLDDALIELNSALKLAPDEADYSERIAQVLVATGKLPQARFYLGEAYRLDPTREGAAVSLAQLLLEDEPEQADALLAELLERNPASAWGHIGRSEQALIEFRLDEASEEAALAVELAPDLADAHWQVARSHQAKIRDRMLEELAHDDAQFEATLAALDRFGEADPTRDWKRRSERARVLAAWPGHAEEAEAALREASRELAELGRARDEYMVLDLAGELGRRMRDPDLERWALQRKVELAPRDYGAWEALATLEERTGNSSAGVYLQMIAALPGETEPQIRFARRLRRVKRPMVAVKYLRARLAEAKYDDAELLAEIARMLWTAQRRDQALETVSELEATHPDARTTQLMLAWALIETGRAPKAIELLEGHDWARNHEGALRILTDAHNRLGNSAAALETIELAIDLMEHPDVASLRARARLLLENGRPLEARHALRDLSRITGLGRSEMTLLARAYLRTGGPGVGIRILERLVDGQDGYEPALYQLFAAAGHSPGQYERLQTAFSGLLARAPNHPGVLDALTQLEITAGTPEKARAAVDRSMAFAVEHGNPTGRLSLLLARIDAASGHEAEARNRLLAILDNEPTVGGLLDFAASLYPTKEEALVAIEELTAGGRSVERPASHHALLARLYYRADNDVMSRWSLEQALNGGLELPILKNDLAYILAKQKRDLKRAELLARQAVQAMPGEPGAIDTLGYVLLQADEYDRAAKQFQQALDVAEQNARPKATIEYHLGVALAKLERFVEAEQAFDRALSLGESFPEEAAAKRELDQLRGRA